MKARLLAMLTFCGPVLLAQFSGRWEGATRVPDQEMTWVLNLDQNDKGEWVGSFDVPSQGLAGIPVVNVAVNGPSLKFELGGIPGKPTFEGKLEGGKVTGTSSQSGQTLPFEMKRTGNAQVDLPAKNGPLGKEFEGEWTGTLQVPNGPALRLVMKLARGADGTGSGTMDSPDQGAYGLLLSGIRQEGNALTAELKVVGGKFEGKLNKDEIAGTWTQKNGVFPLTFKRK